MTPSAFAIGVLNGGGGNSSGGSSSGNSPVWVGFIEIDDETGEAIAADYSGLEVSPTNGLTFNTNYKFRGDWNCDMKFIKDAASMFNGCSNLTSFNGDLSSLTNGTNMFYKTNLTSFNGDLISLTNGTTMFNCCSNLTSFKGDLSSLTNGTNMFSECSNLTSFKGDLSSLTNGTNMFSYCKLDKDSVIRIITCLRESNTCSSSASLTLGVAKQYRNDQQLLQFLGVSSWTNNITITGHGGGTWSIKLQAN